MIGEVGLAGDLRRVTGMDRRLTEAARLGFTTALVPAGCGPAPKGLQTLEAATIGEALRAMLAISEPALEPGMGTCRDLGRPGHDPRAISDRPL